MEHSDFIPVRLLDVKGERRVDLVQARLVPLDCKLKWTDAEGNRLHCCILAIASKEKIIYELGKDLLVGPRQPESLLWLLNGTFLRVCLFASLAIATLLALIHILFLHGLWFIARVLATSSIQRGVGEVHRFALIF